MSMIVILLNLILILISFVQCDQQPNIVVFLVDDLGYNDIGFRGSNQVQTPNIDALAYNGVVLNRFYTLPTCTPSRAAFLTGNYPIRSGMQGTPIAAGESRYIPWNMPTLPERLKELGYKTHLVGKWHLGSSYRNATPTRRGFDSHYGYWNGYIGYFSHYTGPIGYDGLDMHENFTPDFINIGQYATDLFTERATKLINEHDYVSNPLFLFISHLAPHTGELNITTGDTFLEERNSDEMNEKFGYIGDINRRRYVDIVKSADDSLGEIMKALLNKGVMDNTMILFMSDNGGQTFGMHENFASNWPLRGLKFTYFEGAVRGTAIFYSKDILSKGSINDNLIHMSDWLPTFYKAGNGNVENLGNIDGVNQLETILQNVPTTRQELLINIDEVENFSGIISDGGKYKYINGTIYGGIYDGYYGVTGRESENPVYNISAVLLSPTNEALSYYRDLPLTDECVASARLLLETKDCRYTLPTDLSCSPCLFDLKNDPCESRNIAEEESDIVNYLSYKVDQFWNELVPQQNKPFDVNSNPAKFGYVWSPWLDDVPEKRIQLIHSNYKIYV